MDDTEDHKALWLKPLPWEAIDPAAYDARPPSVYFCMEAANGHTHNVVLYPHYGTAATDGVRYGDQGAHAARFEAADGHDGVYVAALFEGHAIQDAVRRQSCWPSGSPAIAYFSPDHQYGHVYHGASVADALSRQPITHHFRTPDHERVKALAEILESRATLVRDHLAAFHAFLGDFRSGAKELNTMFGRRPVFPDASADAGAVIAWMRDDINKRNADALCTAFAEHLAQEPGIVPGAR